MSDSLLAALLYSSILIFVFTIPWRNAITVIPGSVSISKLIGLIVGLLWTCNIYRKNTLTLNLVYHINIFLLVVWASLSAILSPDIGGTISTLVGYIMAGTLSVILYDSLVNWTQWEKVLRAYIWGCVLTTSGIFYSFILNRTDIAGRFTTFGFDQNTSAGILALGVFVCCIIYIKNNDKKKLSIYTVLALFLTSGVLLTGSRQAFGIILISIFYLFIRVLVHGNIIRGVGVGAAGGVSLLAIYYFLPSTTQDRLENIPNAIVKLDFNNRLPTWKESLDIIAANPALGVGPGRYSEVTSAYLGYVRTHPDNTFILVGTEIGAVGLLFFLSILIFSILRYSLLYGLSLWKLGLFSSIVILLVFNDSHTSAEVWLFYTFIVSQASE